MYLALSRKLRFLSQPELAALYENATFVVVNELFELIFFDFDF